MLMAKISHNLTSVVLFFIFLVLFSIYITINYFLDRQIDSLLKLHCSQRLNYAIIYII